MLEMDESEGVHSSQILPLTYKYFDVIHRVDYGGTLLRPFFVGILNNFDYTDGTHQSILKSIALMRNLVAVWQSMLITQKNGDAGH
jgi:hypothetical protein